MISCAYIMNKDCKQCGKKHYYLTNDHVVITGSRDELKEVGILNLEIETYDPIKSDIKKCQNIFGMWPELDTSKEGLLRSISQYMPNMYCEYNSRNIKISDDKNTIVIKYSKLVV